MVTSFLIPQEAQSIVHTTQVLDSGVKSSAILMEFSWGAGCLVLVLITMLPPPRVPGRLLHKEQHQQQTRQPFTLRDPMAPDGQYPMKGSQEELQ